LERLVRLVYTAQFQQLTSLNVIAQVVVESSCKQLQREVQNVLLSLWVQINWKTLLVESRSLASILEMITIVESVVQRTVLRYSCPCTVRRPDPE
jgi:hypothetical protein